MRINKKKISALGAFFVIAAAVAGCGSSSSSSIPGNSVASMAGNPITAQAYKHWMYIAAKDEAAEEPGEPVIVASDPPEFTSCIAQVREQIPDLKKDSATTLRNDCKQVFTQFNSEVMSFLIEGYWYQAQAHKVGINYTAAQEAKDFAKAVKTDFPTSAELKTYLTSSGETEADLKFQVRVNAVYTKLIARVSKKVDSKTIEQYYDAHKQQFGSAETRNIHLVRTTTAAKAQAAYNALKSGQSWDTVAKQYAADAASKANGGLLSGVTNGEEEKAANTVIFSSPTGKVVGPVKGLFGYYVIEVVKITPATQKTLAQSTAQIKQLLTSDSQQTAETAVNNAVKKAWQSKTLCRSTYMAADCKGYVAPKTTTTPATTTPATTTPATTGTTTTATTTPTATTKTSTTGT
jgi:foldase protein PrsA